MKFTQATAAVALLAATVSAGPAPYAPVARRQDDGDRRRLVDSRRLQADIKQRALLRRSQKLQEIAYASPERNRVFGSVGHNATTKYLFDTIAELERYYTVEYQYFVETFSGGDATLSVNNASQPAALFTYAPNGKVTAPLVAVSNLGCNATDYPAEVAGNVALISRGSCEFGLKAALAGAAGASGAVIYNNINGTLSGTLGSVSRPEGPYPPTAGVSLQTGQTLLSFIQQGGATADLNVNAILENRTTQNVIAQTKQGDQNNVLVIGGHSDSVQAGPGINDDGSGTVGILETAIQLAKYRVNNAVRIAWWSAEEFGLLGSEYYVRTLPQEERDKIRLYLNFDMIASPNYFYGIYDGDGSSFNLSGPAGSAEAEKTFEDYFRANRIPFQGTEFSGRSDYGPFLDVGIPAGGLFTGAEVLKTPEEAILYGGEAGVAYDRNYHLVGDTVDNLNMESFLINTRAIADSVAKYAVSFDSLPPVANRTVPARKRDAAAVKRSGCNHKHAEPELY
ncbi:Leucine aminopeptidase 1 [Sphaceloma murrayae]|uniref:Peptide hydrolase n=1 Tax=Sphaceloma murrayae TaxID=2082308 RepID=A0A2K1QZ33_9PEZI|nr:Leucine aminopeptidase 1 [Sphaceloma murrayae]